MYVIINRDGLAVHGISAVNKVKNLNYHVK